MGQVRADPAMQGLEPLRALQIEHGAELRLAAGAFEEHDQIARDRKGDGAA
jgi:hypothetical protein